MNKIYGTMPEAQQFTGLSRTRLYELLQQNKITARKAGRRTLISFASLKDYLAKLPDYKAGA